MGDYMGDALGSRKPHSIAWNSLGILKTSRSNWRKSLTSKMKNKVCNKLNSYMASITETTLVQLN